MADWDGRWKGEQKAGRQEGEEQSPWNCTKHIAKHVSTSSLLQGLSSKQESSVTLKKNIYRPLNAGQ